jgi:8-oxo-dGTP pyrophosphatase MutT (NUDIX family)
MFHFYYNEHRFTITEESNPIRDKDSYVLGNADDKTLFAYIAKVRNGQVTGKGDFVFVVQNENALIKHFYSRVKRIDAAGGLVKNDDLYLAIRRLGKWDLPKGKIETNENIEEAALREVEEECGIIAKIEGSSYSTWHAYDLKHKLVLKQTFWFPMSTEDTKVTPQKEEGITEVVWLDKETLTQKIQEQSYATIQGVVDHFNDW